MCKFEFVVRLRGTGSDEVSAWEDAVTAFAIDPGLWDDCIKLENEEEQ